MMLPFRLIDLANLVDLLHPAYHRDLGDLGLQVFLASPFHLYLPVNLM